MFCDIDLGQIWSDLLEGCCLALGIQVVVEVGLGLGVFAGDALGIGNSVRQLSAPWQTQWWRRVKSGGRMGIGIIGIYTEYIHHVIQRMTSLTSPSWRSLNHLQGLLNHPKKVTKNCKAVIYWESLVGF